MYQMVPLSQSIADFKLMYLKIVLLKAKALGALSRALGRGNGIVIAGRLILKFAPNAVEKIARNKRVVLI
ncbi:MAG: hypothetical protein RL129_1313, partial [Actinomycetota bacterium]